MSERARRIGPWHLRGLLGRGGAARVYEAVHPQSGRVVALKVLPAQDPSAARVRAEYQVLLGIDHPRIVRVLDVGCDADRIFLAMEPLDGRPAQFHARAAGRVGDPRRTAEAARVVQAVAEGLEVLHGLNILHRDVKSSNVLVLRDGGVRLLDLGVARFGRDDGVEGGTLAYASPEQRRGEAQDPRSDLYGLGVLLHRMITGHLVTSEPEALASGLEPLGVPPGLIDLLRALLAPDRAHRPPDARVVVTALDPWVPAGPPTAPSPRWGVVPPIGLEQPIEAIETLIRRGVPGRLLVLEGPRGAGKHRLLDAALAGARRRGARVVHLEANEGLEHGLLGEILLALPRHQRGRSVGDTDPEDRRVTAVAEALWGLSAGPAMPGIVAVSDVHRASSEDRDALARLLGVIRQRAIPVGFLVTATDTGRLGLGADVEVVAVPPLDTGGTACFVAAILGGRESDPGLVGLLHREAAGRPGRVVELLEDVVARGHLVPAALASGRTCWIARSSTELEGPAGPSPEARLADGHLGRAVEDLTCEMAWRATAGTLADRAVTASALGTALAWQGRWSEAWAMLHKELGVQRSGGRPIDLVDLHLVLAAVETDLARLGLAREHLEDAECLLAGRDLGGRAAWLEVARCRVALAAMATADLPIRAAAARTRARAAGGGPLQAQAAGLEAMAWARAGVPDRVLAAAEDAMSEAAGHLPVLARVCAWRHEALGGDPDIAFAPVLGWLAEAGVPTLEMPWRLARLAEARRAGEPEAVRSTLAEARQCLDRIRRRLSTRDRAALDLHPWSRALRDTG